MYGRSAYAPEGPEYPSAIAEEETTPMLMPISAPRVTMRNFMLRYPLDVVAFVRSRALRIVLYTRNHALAHPRVDMNAERVAFEPHASLPIGCNRGTPPTIRDGCGSRAMAFTASALASFQDSGKTVCTASTAASCACWSEAPAWRISL